MAHPDRVRLSYPDGCPPFIRPSAEDPSATLSAIQAATEAADKMINEARRLCNAFSLTHRRHCDMDYGHAAGIHTSIDGKVWATS